MHQFRESHVVKTILGGKIMTMRKTALTFVSAGIGAAAMLTATPAHASINDTYVCERSGEGSLTVVVMAMQPGTAVVYDQAEDSGETVQIALTGGHEEDGEFRFASGGTVFDGSGFDATLDYQRASFICTMPTPNELYEAAMYSRILLDGHGLTVLRPDRGIMQRVPFGTSAEQSIDALDNLMGDPSAPTGNDECPAGPLEFRDFGTLSLHYQNDTLVGWSMNEPMFEPAMVTLPNGHHVGIWAEDLPEWMERMPDSTLGVEYFGDGVHAIADEGDSSVTHLWGGLACTFR